MATCWVKAGECGKETSITAQKVDPTHVVLDVTTSCERVEALAAELGRVDIAREMSCPLTETQVYTLATKHVCRNSCIVPAAILKTIEVTADIFLPADCTIEFLEGAL